MKADSFTKKNFGDFKDSNEFIEDFKKYAETSVANKADRHNLRVNLFKSTQLLNLIEIDFETKCYISKKRPKNHLLCIVFKPCKKYHMFDLAYIYQVFIKGKGNNLFKCPSCDVNITKTTDIQIDILAYHFYDSTEDATARLVLEKLQILQRDLDGKREQLLQCQYQQTLVDIKPNEYTLVKLRLDIKSKKFIMECNKNQEINLLYENIIKQDVKWIDQLFTYDHKGLTKISLICPGSFKRIFNAVFHRDCKHKNIIIFDLEYLIVQLVNSEDNNLKIKCPIPTCESFFTRKNIMDVVKLDSSFRQNLYKEPPCYALGIFNNMTFINKNEDVFIKQSIELALKPHLYSDYIGELKKIISRFWKTKYTVTKWNTFYKKIKVTEQLIRIKIEKSKITYPVRCRNCTNLKFMDLWLMVALIYFNIQQKNYKCPLNDCNLRTDQSNYQEFIYLDVELFKLMQLGVSKVVYSKTDMKYYADINQIGGDILVQQVMITGNYIRDTEFYYKNNFNITIQVKNPKYVQYYIPFILKSCLGKPNLISHIFYIQQKTRDQNQRNFKNSKLTRENFKCNICSVVAKEIIDLFYDPILHKHMQKDNLNGFWMSQQKKFIEKRQKLCDLKIEDIKFKIKKSNKLPENNTKVNILNIKSNIIKFAVYSPKCQHEFGSIAFDLDDYSNYPKNVKCLKDNCKHIFEYVDQIEELTDYMNLINKILESENNLKVKESKYVIYKKWSDETVGTFQLEQPVTKQENLFKFKPNWLSPIKKMSTEFSGNPVPVNPRNPPLLNNKLDDLKKMNIYEFEALPNQIQQQRIVYWNQKDFNLQTHGGIHIFNKGIVPKFII